MDRKMIFKMIEKERERQDQLHENIEDDFEMLAVLTEEVGEVAKALNEDNFQSQVNEIVQVASVCVRWLEQIR